MIFWKNLFHFLFLAFIFFHVVFNFNVDFEISPSKSTLEREYLKNLILDNKYNDILESYKILKNSKGFGDDNYDLYLYVLVKNKRLDLLESLFYKSKSNAGKIYALRGIFELDSIWKSWYYKYTLW